MRRETVDEVAERWLANSDRQVRDIGVRALLGDQKARTFLKLISEYSEHNRYRAAIKKQELMRRAGVNP